jgi:hypothetical protein
MDEIVFLIHVDGVKSKIVLASQSFFLNIKIIKTKEYPSLKILPTFDISYSVIPKDHSNV